jgi:hypothetical protein
VETQNEFLKKYRGGASHLLISPKIRKFRNIIVLLGDLIYNLEGVFLKKGKGDMMKKILNLVLGRILGNSCPECGRPSWNTETHCDRCGTYLDN